MQTVSHKHESKNKQRNALTRKNMTSGRFQARDRDPDMYAVLSLIDQSPYSDAEVAERCDPPMSPATINNWRMGNTFKPQNDSIRRIVRAIGIRRVFADMQGNIIDIPGWEG